MTNDRGGEPKSPIAKRILTYLVRQPDSVGTVESIVEWWLLSNEIEWRVAEVNEALEELVSASLICEREISSKAEKAQVSPVSEGSTSEREKQGKRKIYKINREKMKVIKAFLDQEKDVHD